MGAGGSTARFSGPLAQRCIPEFFQPREQPRIGLKDVVEKFRSETA
ncbi:hypothetical protein [Streptomyces canus]|nr:hypothetical protein [Streptomyces canus]MCX4858957.1 hypothetical protein [Streptomyces canus]